MDNTLKIIAGVFIVILVACVVFFLRTPTIADPFLFVKLHSG